MADTRVFVVYRTVSRWSSRFIVSDEAPVIEALSALAESGEEKNGQKVLEIPFSQYSESNDVDVRAYVSSKIGQPIPSTRIIGLDQFGKVLAVTHHPEPDRFIENRSAVDGLAYEAHDKARVGALKTESGEFLQPIEKLSPVEPGKTNSSGIGGSAKMELSSGAVIIAGPGEIVVISRGGDELTREQGDPKNGGIIRIEP